MCAYYPCYILDVFATPLFWSAPHLTLAPPSLTVAQL